MILTDRHHADLLYAMQILFEDRLGLPLYVPVGYEWWHEGFWQFGKSLGDDRLAKQYLNPDAWQEYAGGLYGTTDPAHPERGIRGVSLDAFRKRGWTFVMPSVQENLPGYAALAEEAGATLLYQVGNTGQRIEWVYDPLVLSTSEADLSPGRGVTIHQEIDSGPGQAFGFYDPYEADRYCVRNAVNAFNRLPGYQLFTQAETWLPDWHFTIHGHEGRDGDINPVGALGQLMRTAGWGWHDKPVGDGFGHVIHAWAAVGRPLIGHAKYYRGRQAEPFWKDGETCLDLGARSLTETTRLMEEIAGDPDRHAAMCHAIREVFDAHVDYADEATAVRQLLDLPA